MKKNVYHGSQFIIEKPDLKKGKKTNDFGRGFYCTEDFDLACEWACQNKTSGYVNEYALDLEGMKVLDLLDGNYSVLNWIALLLENRSFGMSNPTTQIASRYIIENFSPDTDGYDVILGYRADDSYFSYAKSWVGNSMPLRELQQALYLGELGEQIVLKSDKAFGRLEFVGSHVANCDEYYPKYFARDNRAREEFQKMSSKRDLRKSDIFAMDIVREEMRPDDARLQRFVCGRRGR